MGRGHREEVSPGPPPARTAFYFVFEGILFFYLCCKYISYRNTFLWKKTHISRWKQSSIYPKVKIIARSLQNKVPVCRVDGGGVTEGHENTRLISSSPGLTWASRYFCLVVWCAHHAPSGCRPGDFRAGGDRNMAHGPPWGQTGGPPRLPRE